MAGADHLISRVSNPDSVSGPAKQRGHSEYMVEAVPKLERVATRCAESKIISVGAVC